MLQFILLFLPFSLLFPQCRGSAGALAAVGIVLLPSRVAVEQQQQLATQYPRNVLRWPSISSQHYNEEPQYITKAFHSLATDSLNQKGALRTQETYFQQPHWVVEATWNNFLLNQSRNSTSNTS